MSVRGSIRGRLGGSARGRFRRVLGAVALLALGALLAAVASGCSAVRPSPDAAVRVGQCTELGVRQEVDAVSDTNPAVSCTTAHTVQIYALTAVSGRFASWKERPDLQILKGMQGQLCGIPALRAFVGAGERDGISELQIHAYFPTIAAWSAGSRTVSCTVSLAGSGAQTGGPATIDYSLAGIMSGTDSARVRSCYVQQALSGGGWGQSGSPVDCAQKHSTQDLNAWLPAAAASVPAAQVASSCTPYALQFLGAQQLPAGIVVSGVVTQDDNGTYTLRCTIGGDSGHGDVTGAILGAA